MNAAILQPFVTDWRYMATSSFSFVEIDQEKLSVEILKQGDSTPKPLLFLKQPALRISEHRHTLVMICRRSTGGPVGQNDESDKSSGPN